MCACVCDREKERDEAYEWIELFLLAKSMEHDVHLSIVY